MDASKIGRRRFPVEVGEFQLTLGTNESRFRPIGPVTRIAITPVRDDEIKFTSPSNICLDIDVVPFRLGVDDLAGKDGLGRRPRGVPRLFPIWCKFKSSLDGTTCLLYTSDAADEE